MNKSLVVLALLMCGVVKAQTGFVEFPYNPDSDGDDFIGITDLLSLLSLYESEFSEEGLYLTSDSTEALYYTGNKAYAQCHKSCHDLPGNWWVPYHEEILNFDLGLLNYNPKLSWIQFEVRGRTALDINYVNNYFAGKVVQIGGQEGSNTNPLAQNGFVHTQYFSESFPCLCYTRERPRVEYVYCDGTSIQSCVDQKVAEGWYPLGGLNTHEANEWLHTVYGQHHIIGSSPYYSQSFWRWKE
jgi:hypothetical protein